MTSQDPLVSVGIPVYNGQRTLRKALDSLLAQTYHNLDLVISDNASTDGTGEICLEYAARDPRIRYFRNPVNLGVYANFRRLITLANGEYFTWAAIDDIKPPTAVEACLQALMGNQGAVLAHGVVLLRTSASEELFEYPNRVHAVDIIPAGRIRKFTNDLQHNDMFYGLYRRDALILGKLGSHCGQDYLLCLQMCLLGEVEYVPQPITIRQERKAIPSSSPMYTEAPMTLNHLITANKIYRRKCWTVLLLGSYYLATVGNVPWKERVGAIAAHVIAFSSLHRSRLAKEIIYQAFEPVVRLCAIFWRVTQRGRYSWRIARKLRSLLGA
jgi:glycosyltransferase involved in cell wall biosynthesis